ncbi:MULTISPECIES: DEAD/DEAH box helicase [unclassified Archaeoglobus]|uniref:DEAD/DEAH box helicase n=1 Tax=unclassified Archaeoglobus TaxID=2643606 RepID=UPI0025C143FD|nr:MULTISPECIES: DEAD/DEAH box helicase [unclassified Archaeoglobus]
MLIKSVFNPLEATENIQREYFEFFLTSFAPNNEELQELLREQIPTKYLWRGPYISILPPIKQGDLFIEFERERISQAVKKAFSNIQRLYVHQEEAISKIIDSRNVIAAVPTGSGKTEIFMIPILQYCYEHRGEPGVKAILIYPMNALAKDQVERLRKILWTLNKDLPESEKITFAIYTGDTPKDKRELEKLERFTENCFLTDLERRIYGCPENCDTKQIRYSANDEVLYCPLNKSVKFGYQILTRDRMRKNPPDILITNYVQLEHILTRKKDSSWLDKKAVKFVVLDEIHTYTGSKGIDIAFLIRRLKERI